MTMQGRLVDAATRPSAEASSAFTCASPKAKSIFWPLLRCSRGDGLAECFHSQGAVRMLVQVRAARPSRHAHIQKAQDMPEYEDE